MPVKPAMGEGGSGAGAVGAGAGGGRGEAPPEVRRASVLALKIECDESADREAEYVFTV